MDIDEKTQGWILKVSVAILGGLSTFMGWLAKSHIDKSKETAREVAELKARVDVHEEKLQSGTDRFDRLESKLDKHDEKLAEVRQDMNAGFQRLTELMLERRDRRRADDP